MLKQYKHLSLYLTLLILTFSLVACGGGGSGGGDGDAITNINSAGFPVAAGTYAFTTAEISFTCSDNSSGTAPALSQNLVISQVDNVITMSKPAGTSTDIPGITIINAGDNTGTITKSASFTTSQIITVYFDQLFSNATVNYSVTGTFTNSGWSGNYRFIVTFTDLAISCDYSTTFSGSKINSSTTAVEISDGDNYPSDYYPSDYYQDISRVGALL